MIELVCLRHGQTDWNRERRLQGRTDIPLNSTGERWAREHRVPAPFNHWYWWTSPLQRARQTAAALGLEATPCAALIEMSFGLWEGQRLSELRAADPEGMAQNEARGLDLLPLGGESPRQVGVRLQGWLATLPPGCYGALCHKAVIRALLAVALDWPMLGVCPQSVDWQALQRFRWSPQCGLQLVQANIVLEPRFEPS